MRGPVRFLVIFTHSLRGQKGKARDDGAEELARVRLALRETLRVRAKAQDKELVAMQHKDRAKRRRPASGASIMAFSPPIMIGDCAVLSVGAPFSFR